MSKETLLQRLDEWTLEKAKAAISMMPASDRNCYLFDLFEYADNGIYIYNSYAAKFMTNEGNIETALLQTLKYPELSTFTVPRSIDKDFDILNQLYTSAQSSSNIQLAVVNEVSTVNGYEYRSYTSPNGQLGISHSAEVISNSSVFDEEYVTKFIDDIAWIIKQVNSIDSSGAFPNLIKSQNRLKNDVGYYYYDLVNFSNSYTDFYDSQMAHLKKIIHSTNSYNLSGGYLSNYQESIDYAEKVWTI
jgi:hypothetical protein